MRDSGQGGEASWRWVPGAELSGEDGEAVSGCRIQPQCSPLLRHPAFLFCILHRGELPHPAFISPLCIPSPHPSALVCETCSRQCFPISVTEAIVRLK